MTASPVFVELCAGTASVSLRAMLGADPLVGMMGSKRRWASQLTAALEVARPEQVLLVDGGPWGDCWQVLQSPAERAQTARLLEAWDSVQLQDLWRALVAYPPPDDPAERAAQFLFLQARSAGAIPVWWDAELGEWQSPTGSRTEEAHRRGGCALGSRHKGRAYEAGGLERRRAMRGGAAVPKLRGLQRPSTIARRLRRIDRMRWDCWTVVRDFVQRVRPIPGATVLLDPPYVGCPRYPVLFPRAEVLATARAWHEAGARVAVCEAEPLRELVAEGWTARRLPGKKPEWLTASWSIRVDEQLALFAEAA